MLLEEVVAKLQNIPSEYLTDVANYIDTLKAKIEQDSKEERIEIAKSLFGVLPADIKLENLKAERLI